MKPMTPNISSLRQKPRLEIESFTWIRKSKSLHRDAVPLNQNHYDLAINIVQCSCCRTSEVNSQTHCNGSQLDLSVFFFNIFFLLFIWRMHLHSISWMPHRFAITFGSKRTTAKTATQNETCTRIAFNIHFIYIYITSGTKQNKEQHEKI